MKKSRTTQGDGLVERFNCTLAAGLGPPPVLWSYRTAIQDRMQVVHDLARKVLANAGQRQKWAYDTHCRGLAFEPGNKVWVFCPIRRKGLSPKLQRHWQGPGEVTDCLSEVVNQVRLPG